MKRGQGGTNPPEKRRRIDTPVQTRTETEVKSNTGTRTNICNKVGSAIRVAVVAVAAVAVAVVAAAVAVGVSVPSALVALAAVALIALVALVLSRIESFIQTFENVTRAAKDVIDGAVEGVNTVQKAIRGWDWRMLMCIVGYCCCVATLICMMLVMFRRFYPDEWGCIPEGVGVVAWIVTSLFLIGTKTADPSDADLATIGELQQKFKRGDRVKVSGTRVHNRLSWEDAKRMFEASKTIGSVSGQLTKDIDDDGIASVKLLCSTEIRVHAKSITKIPSVRDLFVNRIADENLINHLEQTIERLYRQSKIRLPDPNNPKILVSGLNMVLLGLSGCGKSTSAKIIHDVLMEHGVLTGQFYDIHVQDLKGSCRGEGTKKTREYFEKASHGTLFIDEYYSAFDPNDKDPLANEVLMKLMEWSEKAKGEMCIILGGYEEDMGKAMTANQGLLRRFPEDARFILAVPSVESIAKWMLDDVKHNATAMNATVKVTFDDAAATHLEDVMRRYPTKQQTIGVLKDPIQRPLKDFVETCIAQALDLGNESNVNITGAMLKDNVKFAQPATSSSSSPSAADVTRQG